MSHEEEKQISYDCSLIGKPRISKRYNLLEYEDFCKICRVINYYNNKKKSQMDELLRDERRRYLKNEQL